MAVSKVSDGVVWGSLFVFWPAIRSQWFIVQFRSDVVERQCCAAGDWSRKSGSEYGKLLQWHNSEYAEHPNRATSIQLHANRFAVGKIRLSRFETRLCSASRLRLGSFRKRNDVDPHWLRHLLRADSIQFY